MARKARRMRGKCNTYLGKLLRLQARSRFGGKPPCAFARSQSKIAQPAKVRLRHEIRYSITIVNSYFRAYAQDDTLQYCRGIKLKVFAVQTSSTSPTAGGRGTNIEYQPHRRWSRYKHRGLAAPQVPAGAVEISPVAGDPSAPAYPREWVR